ncbi:HAD family hydrolase [Lacibacter luteus]|uniref:HAD family hydrolase n=1 Tax=Lacibacter luteus TaxID=2508719 RepID=A0A4Q1CH08_9BACT|nr:HAD-IA family hydrolase [Lacibacter luteus]RXK59353.1 HAD family hydrolase [Lacibacter luteus]
MSNYSLVVFDMAGTTVYDKGDVADAFIRSLQQFGIEVPEPEVNKVMGWRKKDAIVLLLSKYHPEKEKINDVLVDQIHDVFIDNMVTFYERDEELKPMQDAEELFAWLKKKNIKVALNTGFTRRIADVILQKLGWNDEQLVDFVIASDEVTDGRPYPFMIEQLMQHAGVVNAADVVKVGDTEVDVLEGRNANCGLVVSVTTGAYTKEQLQNYKPDHIIDSLNELPLLIA